jgi:1-acyl-sn-glycerol-3-phosphate acyltransferase
LFSWDFLKGGPGVFRVRQHQFITTKELSISEMENIKDTTFDIIYTDLTQDTKYMKDTRRTK